MKEEAEAVHLKDGEWFSPTVNPFLHICCDCGLTHTVEFRFVNNIGEEVRIPDGYFPVFKFSRHYSNAGKVGNNFEQR